MGGERRLALIELLNANALSIPLADGSVQMVATSPPYWGLRNYKVDGQLGQERLHDCLGWATGNFCGECYVCHTLAWTREVRRVLRDDGVFWCNLGDSYNGSGGAGGDYNKGGLKEGQPRYAGRKATGLKAKDLAGIPWRVALALQADGWYLRRDVIWHKRNPMPESAGDRPTTSHEYVFLFSKSPHYYWDKESVKEPAAYPNDDRGARTDSRRLVPWANSMNGKTGEYRNIRSVWTLSSSPYRGCHYATWPPLLVEPMIKAGTSEKGCCPACGKPWVRVIEKGYRAPAQEDVIAEMVAKGVPRQKANLYGNPTRDPKLYAANPDKTTGWRPACDHDAEPIPCVVLDPFIGSGTTALVARQLGRSAIGLDLSFTYLRENATKRLELDKLKAWSRK